jgi:collagenase-like PrtC family protease
MKKVIGINSYKEALYLIDHVDEIYFGLRSIKNHRIWYDYLNVSDIDEAIKIIKLAKDKNKKSYIAANEAYSQREIENVIKTIRTLLSNGLDGIILKDINLASYFKNKTDIILSSTAIVFNTAALNFYIRNTGLNRIIIPQHLKPSDAIDIMKIKCIQYEIFYLIDLYQYCYNVDGVCTFHYFDGKIRREANCEYPFKIKGKEMNMKKCPSIYERAMMIYKYYKMGAKYIKLSRDETTDYKLKLIKDVNLLLAIIKRCNSEKTFIQVIKKYF